MPDLSKLVPFHSGQVRNFSLFVLEQVFRKISISDSIIIMNSNVVWKTVFSIEFNSWFYTAFKRVHVY